MYGLGREVVKPKGEHEGHEGNRERAQSFFSVTSAFRAFVTFVFALGLYSAQRLKISEPFVPPKPKEFERAMSTFALRE